MHKLNNRVAALEQSTHRGDTVIIIRYDCPKEPGREMFNLEGSYSDTPRQHWTRLPDESEQDFKDRASKEVTRNQYGVATLFQCD